MVGAAQALANRHVQVQAQHAAYVDIHVQVQQRGCCGPDTSCKHNSSCVDIHCAAQAALGQTFPGVVQAPVEQIRPEVKSHTWALLKGQCHESVSPKPLSISCQGCFNFFQKFAQIVAAQGEPIVPMTLVANGKNLQSEKF